MGFVASRTVVVREHFVLDTGPLLEFLVLRYQTETGARWPDSFFQFQALPTRLDREDFEKFLKVNSGRLATSSGVAAEMHRFLQRAEDSCGWRQRQGLRDRFWRLVCGKFRELKMGEDAIRLIEMAETILIDYGPVDASLLELAKRPVEHVDRVVVLTSDGRFLKLCQKKEIPAEFVADRLKTFRAEF